jgi:hypothetical protein
VAYDTVLSYTTDERCKLADPSILAFEVNTNAQIKISAATPIGAFTLGFSSYYQCAAELHFKFSSLDHERIFQLAHSLLLGSGFRDKHGLGACARKSFQLLRFLCGFTL